MNKLKLKAPATTGNAGPGYDVFAVALDRPYDEVHLELNETKKISIEIIGNDQEIPEEPDKNSAGIAAKELLSKAGLEQGVHIRIIKKMPSGGGLGTTGTSAAAAVVGLNKLLDLQFSLNELTDVARMGEIASGGDPHADNVAASIFGGFVIVRNYNPLEVLKVEVPEFPVVLAVQKKTYGITRGLISFDIGEEKIVNQIANCASMVHALYQKDSSLFGKACSVDHIAEPARAGTIPGYREVKKQVLNAGAFGCNISGGGSSIFAICDEKNQDSILEIMKEGFKRNGGFVDVIKTKFSNLGVQEIK